MKRNFLRILKVTVWFVGFLALLSLLEQYWITDLVAQFILHLSLAGLVALGFLILPERQFIHSIPVLLCLCVLTLKIWGSEDDFTKVPIQGTGLKVISLNLNSANLNHELFLKYIREADPDVLVLTELSQNWVPAIEQLSPDFQNLVTLVRNDNFGIGIISKFPLQNEEKLLVGDGDLPAIGASVRTPKGLVSIFGVHPMPPIFPEAKRIRDEYLGEVAKRLSEISGPAIVCGDFNLTPWTFAMNRFEKVSGLRRPKGMPPVTWPAVIAPIGISIDHCLVSRDLSVVRYSSGRGVGSDHLPLELEVN